MIPTRITTRSQMILSSLFLKSLLAQSIIIQIQKANIAIINKKSNRDNPNTMKISFAITLYIITQVYKIIETIQQPLLLQHSQE